MRLWSFCLLAVLSVLSAGSCSAGSDRANTVRVTASDRVNGCTSTLVSRTVKLSDFARAQCKILEHEGILCDNGIDGCGHAKSRKGRIHLCEEGMRFYLPDNYGNPTFVDSQRQECEMLEQEHHLCASGGRKGLDSAGDDLCDTDTRTE